MKSPLFFLAPGAGAVRPAKGSLNRRREQLELYGVMAGFQAQLGSGVRFHAATIRVQKQIAKCEIPGCEATDEKFNRRPVLSTEM